MTFFGWLIARSFRRFCELIDNALAPFEGIGDD